jgi:nicotinamide-nucleotide amidase
VPRAPDTRALAEKVIAACRAKHLTLTTAESCTGGLLAAALTAIPGASECFAGGFVTYSDAFKSKFLGVPGRTLKTFGAVSEEVAHAMAEGALGAADADLALAVTGIAGPGGGSPDKPVGLVHFAVAKKHNGIHLEVHRFPPEGRDRVRDQAALTALRLLLAAASKA